MAEDKRVQLGRALRQQRHHQNPELGELTREQVFEEVERRLRDGQGLLSVSDEALAEEASQLLESASGRELPRMDLVIQTQQFTRKAIHGKDEREEVPQGDALLQSNAEGVVVLVLARDLTLSGGRWHVLKPQTLNQRLFEGKLREGERFRDDVSLGLGSGFLVNSRMVLTAKHCTFFDPYMTQEMEPEDLLVVRGFTQGGWFSQLSFAKDQVHEVASIERSGDALDWARLSLKEPIAGVEGLPLASTQADFAPIEPHLAVYVLGHPSGLALKHAPGGRVIKAIPGDPIVLATTDTFQGNSGSPVFDAFTHAVVGVLVAGAPDYKKHSDGTHSAATYPSYEELQQMSEEEKKRQLEDIGECVLRIERIPLPRTAKLLEIKLESRVDPAFVQPAPLPDRKEVVGAFGQLLSSQRTMVLARLGVDPAHLDTTAQQAQALLKVLRGAGRKVELVEAIRSEAPAYLRESEPTEEQIIESFSSLLPAQRESILFDLELDEVEDRFRVDAQSTARQIGIALYKKMAGEGRLPELVEAIRGEAPAFL